VAIRRDKLALGRSLIEVDPACVSSWLHH
jgi:hypothetical protein